MKQKFKESLYYLFIAMRPYQWTKNIFVFMPLIFGEKLFHPFSVMHTTIAFILFSLGASSLYLANDLVDITHDRQHRSKKLRPLAASKITKNQCLFLAILLGIGSLTASFQFRPQMGTIILTYFGINYLYMKKLKKVIMLDVVCIGAGFLLRIQAGSLAANVTLSPWIIICSTLLAVFLAFNKRRCYLMISGEEGKGSLPAPYHPKQLHLLTLLAIFCILIAYTLYTIDPQTHLRIGSYNLLISIPFVGYGLFHYNSLIGKRRFSGDPARVLLKDHKMQITLAGWLVACISVIYF